MKEGGDCSSERWRRHGRTTPDARSTTPEWAALPPELVQHIASSVLSTTGGVDAYMDMRAVCPTWRSAIAKPSPLAAFADLRFRPRHWVMVDLQSENHDDDGACLFLHATTGRFRRLRLPVFRDHLVLGASDGLIVLRDKEHPHLPHVLNPLTGGMLHFAAPLWEHLGSADVLYTAVSGGPRSTLVVWRKDWEWRLHTVIYADPTSPEFIQQETGTELLASMVTFQGILLGLGNNRLHFALAIHARTAPAMTMEAVTRGHRHLKWGGGAQQVSGSHGTRIRQHGDNGVAVGA
jgi:hypothetical protein